MNPLYSVYNSRNLNLSCFNGNIGKSYNLNSDRVSNLPCNNWHCPLCRPKKKYDLFLNSYYNAVNLSLNKHIVLTFGGKYFRSNYSMTDSYRIMSHIWNKYKKVIQYKYDFDYICFPRAQQDGYCHYHILLNSFIPWKFLEEKRKLYSKEGLGWNRINKNIDASQYLSTDFFKDNEFWIPKNVNRYRTSRGIKFTTFSSFDEKISIIGKVDLETLERRVLKKYGRLLPYSYYLRHYYVNDTS